MNPGTMTSSPAPMPRLSRVIQSAAEPPPWRASACLTPVSLAIASSTWWTFALNLGIVGGAVAAQVAALEHLHHLGRLFGADELDPGSGHGFLPRYRGCARPGQARGAYGCHWMSIRWSRRFLS